MEEDEDWELRVGIRDQRTTIQLWASQQAIQDFCGQVRSAVQKNKNEALITITGQALREPQKRHLEFCCRAGAVTTMAVLTPILKKETVK